jgi:hypothetical protein
MYSKLNKSCLFDFLEIKKCLRTNITHPKVLNFEPTSTYERAVIRRSPGVRPHRGLEAPMNVFFSDF